MQDNKPHDEALEPEEATDLSVIHEPPQYKGPGDEAFNAYVLEPSAQNLNRVVEIMQPTIRQSLASFNAANDPVLQVSARALAANAVKDFDPSRGANLATHISSRLQQLRRKRREVQSPARMPERLQLAAYQIHEGELELEDKLGREPDVNELSDHLQMGVDLIEKVRKQNRPVVHEGAAQAALGDSALTFNLPDHMDEAVEYVYMDEDYIGKKILEHRGGYGGAEVLGVEEIAQRFNISPSMVSRRANELALKIQELEDAIAETS